ncbi:MAG: adenine deaminase [Clostridiales bacterium]|nr:adenine deaminase [Clostridiales bacterium]
MATVHSLKKVIQTSLGKADADLIIRNAAVLNVFTEQFEQKDIAIKDGLIAAVCASASASVSGENDAFDCCCANRSPALRVANSHGQGDLPPNAVRGRFHGVEEIDASGKAVVPGFIDGHMHLESSLVSPKQYCKSVVPHGTTAIIADPHEISNVLGKIGFSYILEATRGLPLDIYLMVPSCVPATPFDESGATIAPEDIAQLLALPNVLGLAEMMDFPGVLGCHHSVLEKLALAQNAGKIIDGHAPGLSGKDLNAYIAAGVRSDHECSTAEEAMEKISLGQWVMIREGTACKNLLNLLSLFEKPWSDRCMLVTDDKHPGDLMREGHIDHIIRKAIAHGADPVRAYKMASYNASLYFGLSQNGAISPGYQADFVILDDIRSVKIHSVYKKGKRIDAAIDDCIDALNGTNPYALQVCDTIHIPEITEEDFTLKKTQEKIIGLVPGEILTTDEGFASEIDVANGICKVAVIERHHNTGHMGVAFLKGYGLKKGAVATSVAHDSHNVIVAGASERDMAFAVSQIKRMQGGMVVVADGTVKAELALPIAGLMCDLDAESAEWQLTKAKAAARELGVSTDIDPFMTLSFSSLAVIPRLRLTTKGVVEVGDSHATLL